VARRALRGAVIVLPIAALAAWSATMQLATLEAAPGGGAGFRATPLTSGQYLLTQVRVQWLYLRLLAWPAGLSIDRPFEASRALDPAALLAASGLVLAVGLALWTWARAERSPADAPTHRLVAFGILFWIVVLSPTSSVVPVMDLAVEHRVYLASLGPFLACVAAADALLFGRLAPRTARMVATALALSALVPLGVALRVRADAWSSPAGIWREAEALAPASPRIVVNLGAALAQAGDVPGAEAAFQRAWSLVRDPDSIVALAQNHGGLLLVNNRPAEALAVLDRALRVGPRDAGFWSNRSSALGYLGRNREALEDARLAASLEPRDPLYRNMLGVALLISGDANGALAEFAEAEALDPGNPQYPVTAAVALELAGRRTEACATYRRARATARQLPLPGNVATRAARLGCPIE
jgi:Flp pilus assembly protein TadD